MRYLSDEFPILFINRMHNVRMYGFTTQAVSVVQRRYTGEYKCVASNVTVSSRVTTIGFAAGEQR